MEAAASLVQRSDIRRCTADDIPFIIEVGSEVYTEGSAQREQHAADWLRARMALPNMLFVRGNRSFGIAYAQPKFWLPDVLDVTQLFLAAKRCTGAYLLEPMYIIDYMRNWARQMGAKRFFFGDLTGIDMSSYAERRGARLAGHTYVFDLTE